MAKSDLETALERARRSTTAAATRPSRVGKKGMLIHIDPELSRRLKHLAVDEDKTLQQLGVEALDRDAARVPLQHLTLSGAHGRIRHGASTRRVGSDR